MKLHSIQINDVRNICEARIEALSAINLFHGGNGAGKTSILEAIHFLGMGRSFRSARVKPFINYSAALCRVVATFEEDGKFHRIGIERPRRGGFTIKIDGKKATSASALAKLIPLQLLNADTFKLLEGGPKERRQMIDWGVFHVEHSFFSEWSRSRKAIKQRNSLLRKGMSERQLRAEIAPWNREIAETSVSINNMRRRYVQRFVPLFQSVLSELLTLESPIGIEFNDGWQSEARDGDAKHYLKQLEDSLERDARTGLTHYGPHRADLALTIQGLGAADVLSRGQQKMTVAAMKLAQSRLFSEDTGRNSILLADDIPAEMDEHHQQKLFELLGGEGMQIFLTSVSNRIPGMAFENIAMFHVKQGGVQNKPANSGPVS